jgi:nucleotide-binding universal stress UspA family protein
MSWLPKQRVLVPFDFSDASASAIDTALELVPRPSAIDVVYVRRARGAADPVAMWVSDDEQALRAKQTLDERLAARIEAGIRTHARVGDPGREIVRLARELDTDLIVIPSHGRHGLDRILLGSVAERVVRLAPCPVLVLRVRE